MSSLRVVARAVFDCVYLFRSQYQLSTKVRILYEYWRLTLKLLLVAPLVTLRRERILGFRVESFDYETLHFLFREIFVRSQYWFACPTDRPLILDCGANIGLATIFFKWLYPHSSVHSFEPDRQTFEMLARNVRANRLPQVYLHNVALTNAPGAVEFFVAATRPGSLLMSLDPQRVPKTDAEKTLVDGAKLSTFVNGRPVDLLKLDVEGAERIVMEDLVASGAIEMVRELVLEYHHHADRRRASLGEFLCLLEEAGFEYQLDAAWASRQSHGEFQDVLLYAFRPDASRSHGQGIPT